MTHYAVIRRSGRPVPVTVCGRIMIYEHPLTSYDRGLQAMGLPYGHVNLFRRNDRRFRLMPRGWIPEGEHTSVTDPDAGARAGASPQTERRPGDGQVLPDNSRPRTG